MNYISMLSSLDESLCVIAKKSLVTIFESIDKSFKITTERKSKYDVKSHHERTIMTIFGEITFSRTFYTSKLSGNNYCYLDRLLGLHKYNYFDPYLKAIIVDYLSFNSMPKTAKYVNDLIGSRIKLDNAFKYISRQTVRNIIISAKLSIVNNSKTLDSENIYLIADEKWIHTQNNNKEDVMEKAIIVFDDIKNHKIINKRIFASLNHSFLDNALDYIYETYNCDNIKNIFVIGDGAGWIKSLKHHFNFSC